MRRAYLSILIFAALHTVAAHAGAASPATHGSARAPHQVRITLSQLAAGETSVNIGPTEWTLQGYDLRGLLARIYDVDAARVDVAAPERVGAQQQADATTPRYDVSLSLSGDESDEVIQGMLRKALEERLHVKAAFETRSQEVYVLTAPAGAGKGLRSVAELRVSGSHARSGMPSTITVEGRVCPGISSAGITGEAATLERLASALEDNLDRVVVDETNLRPAYNFQVPEYHSREELFSLLRDRLGVTVTPERRDVKVLAVHAAEASAAAMMAGI